MSKCLFFCKFTEYYPKVGAKKRWNYPKVGAKNYSFPKIFCLILNLILINFCLKGINDYMESAQKTLNNIHF
jgi:hypothetical protein